MKENRVPGCQGDPHFWISVVLQILVRGEKEKGFQKIPKQKPNKRQETK